MRHFLGGIAFCAMLLSPTAYGAYSTQLAVNSPSVVKPGERFQISAKLTGKFFVKWIKPQASGQGAYIVLYRGSTEIGRYRINESNTAVTGYVSEPGPSGWNDILGMGSETTAKFTVVAPEAIGAQEFTVVYTGEKWSNSATSGVFNIRFGYPDSISTILPLILDDE